MMLCGIISVKQLVNVLLHIARATVRAGKLVDYAEVAVLELTVKELV